MFIQIAVVHNLPHPPENGRKRESYVLKKQRMERHRLGKGKETAHCCGRVTHSAADCGCHQERSTETERGFLFRKGAFDEEGEWAWARQRAREVEREAKRVGEGRAQDRKKRKMLGEKEKYTLNNADFQRESFWLAEGEEQQKKLWWQIYLICIVICDRRDMLKLTTTIPHPLVFKPECSSSLGFYWWLRSIYSSPCLIFQKAWLSCFSLSNTPQGGGLTRLRFPLVVLSARNSHHQLVVGVYLQIKVMCSGTGLLGDLQGFKNFSMSRPLKSFRPVSPKCIFL